MDPKKLVEILKSHPFLENFRLEHIEKLAGMASQVSFQPDQIIFREGDESSLFYLLLEGKVALETRATGRTLRIQTLQAGDELGWSSVVKPVQKFFQARSIDPVKALAFDGARLLEACDQDCSFGYALMRRVLGVVAERLQATRVQLLDVYRPGGSKAS